MLATRGGIVPYASAGRPTGTCCGSPLFEYGEQARDCHAGKVSFALEQVVLDIIINQKEELKRYAAFNHALGFPVCLEDIGLSPADLPAIPEKAPSVTEWRCVPYQVTKERFVQAIPEADACGKSIKHR